MMKLGQIQIDCKDPVAQARFWATALELEPSRVLGDPPHYAGVEGPAGQPQLSFQRVPEDKIVKNRIHLDIFTEDLETAITRLAELGAETLESEDRSEYGFTWRVMADPAGNEFCIVAPDDVRATEIGVST